MSNTVDDVDITQSQARDTRHRGMHAASKQLVHRYYIVGIPYKLCSRLFSTEVEIYWKK